MIDVALLRPSDIERLMSLELTEMDKVSILVSIEAMLREIVADGGAGSDRIFLAAQSLNMAGVWNQIAADELALAISRAPHEARKVFLEGLPHRYAADVSLAILTQAPGRHSGVSLVGQQAASDFGGALEGMIRAVDAIAAPRLPADLGTRIDEALALIARSRAQPAGAREPAGQAAAQAHPMREAE